MLNAIAKVALIASGAMLFDQAISADSIGKETVHFAQYTETVRPPTVPPGPPVSPPLMGNKQLYTLAQKGIWELTKSASDSRISSELQEALSRAVNQAAQALTASNASGALYMAAYEQQRNADSYAGLMPPNVSTRLIGGNLRFVGVGTSPMRTLAVSFARNNVYKDADSSKDFVPLRTEKAFWITRDESNNLVTEAFDLRPMEKEVRHRFIDTKFKERTVIAERFELLGNSLDRLVTTSKDDHLRVRAAQLILEREAALEALNKLDGSLEHELKKARKSAAQVRSMQIAGAVLGVAGAATGGGATQGPVSPKNPTSTSDTTGSATPNSVLLDSRTYEFLKDNEQPVSHIPNPM
ncbi:hypothetical protein [Microvirga tunisiensis]|uniref:Uncharacterized protein n=1 Tax=Microvirga tunisiensis TaxID=2108360 RepID=A0A5N7MND7_9HYPH|nr:hypothetical protein [Microvirga tunisiensis]MPR11133.1 hypothetical protein [Microvirga tunisiensis]MPR28527.1 hypothetical protein [Microvirga tunisiensis]